MRADRLIHFGMAPWQWLQPVLGHPDVTMLMDMLYYVWIPFVTGLVYWQAWSVDRRAAHALLPDVHRRLDPARARCWRRCCRRPGPASTRPSPARPSPYAPLMAYLHGGGPDTHPLISLEVQGILLHEYQIGHVSPWNAISAMPSIHVAMPVVFTMLAWQTDRLLGAAFAVFGVIVFLGSVHLGWHYAVDGYVSVLTMIAVWRLTGWFVPRYLGPLDRPSRAVTGIDRAARPGAAAIIGATGSASAATPPWPSTSRWARASSACSSCRAWCTSCWSRRRSSCAGPPGEWHRGWCRGWSGYLHTFLIIGFLQVAARLASRVGHRQRQRDRASWPGSYLWLMSSILGLWPLWYLRRSFSLEPEARQLVVAGPYRLARHPIYAVYILNNTGIWLRTLSMPFLSCCSLWFALLAASGPLRGDRCCPPPFPSTRPIGGGWARSGPGSPSGPHDGRAGASLGASLAEICRDHRLVIVHRGRRTSRSGYVVQAVAVPGLMHGIWHLPTFQAFLARRRVLDPGAGGGRRWQVRDAERARGCRGLDGWRAAWAGRERRALDRAAAEPARLRAPARAAVPRRVRPVEAHDPRACSRSAGTAA